MKETRIENGCRLFFRLRLFRLSLLCLVALLLADVPVVHAQSGQMTKPARGPSLDPEEKILQFGVLQPERPSYTIEGITIEHDSPRSVPITISVTGLWHADTNFPLDNEKWCVLSPSQGSASRDHPFLFNFTIGFPKKMPVGLPDGLYKGKLKVESVEAEAPIWVPFMFTLDFPDFSPVPAGLAETGMTVEMFCCLPDSRKLSFGVTTDAMTDQAVRLIAPPLLISEATGASIPPGQVRILASSSGNPDADILVSRGKKPTRISLKAVVDDPQLAPGLYSGQLAVRSKMGRTLYVPIHLSIPSSFLVETLWKYSAAGTLFIALLWLMRPTRRLLRGRNRFQRSQFEVRRQGTAIRVPNPWRRFITFNYLEDREVWQLTGAERFQVSADPVDPFSPPGTALINRDEGARRISLSRPRETYGLQLVSGWSPYTLRFRILRSPYRRGRILFEWILYGLLIALGLVLILQPELLCRMIP